MKLTKIEQVEDFINVVKSCDGNVFLTSNDGDRYNLKSDLSRYVAISQLLGKHGDELELWCDKYPDELKFMNYFRNNPSVL